MFADLADTGEPVLFEVLDGRAEQEAARRDGGSVKAGCGARAAGWLHPGKLS
ncbi:hypothetical protein ACIBQ1_40435 [Nonomuraea sp. NPDC050153]|uniref:hypothetical protein n=1 Tax=Nonomuraea sp. NPDC050153 TaxID=3364359 RepID=UPI0037AC90D4